jgi:hypothetical protein
MAYAFVCQQTLPIERLNVGVEAPFLSEILRARAMKTLTHFLDTPKPSEISARLQPLPISSTTCDSRELNNISRSSLTAFRLLRFLLIVRKSTLTETV